MKHLARPLALAGLLLLPCCNRGEAAADLAKTSSYSETEAGPSLFDLQVTLTNQSGATLSLDAFRGHPTLISMFYADCPYACPTLISDVKRIEEKLPADARKNVRVLLVSFDPERDTPARLQALVHERKLDERRWTLASANDDQVRELAAVLGIKYRRLEGGGYNHSSSIVLLRADGSIAARTEGLAQPVDDLAARAASLAISGS